MLIDVMFRDTYKREFSVGPYCYETNLDVKKDDLVLVETKFGISLAKVDRLNVRLVDEKNRPLIKNVLEICKTR